MHEKRLFEFHLQHAAPYQQFQQFQGSPNLDEFLADNLLELYLVEAEPASMDILVRIPQISLLLMLDLQHHYHS